MNDELDGANDAAMESFDTSDCDSAQVQCPKKPGFIKRKLLNLKRNIRKLFSKETWAGLNIMKDNVGSGGQILNMHGVTIDAIFHRFDKEMEKDGFIEPKPEPAE